MEKIYNPDLHTKMQYLENAKQYTKDISQLSYELLEINKGQKVLEFGCGGGYDVFNMSELVGSAGQLYGVDIDAETVQYAQNKNQYDNVFFEQNVAKSLRFEENTFDRIRAERVLQHVPNAEETIEDLLRVLKPNGKIGIIETDWESLCFFSPLPDIEQKIRKFITNVVSSNALVARKMSRNLFNNKTSVKQIVYSHLIDKYAIADAFIRLEHTLDVAQDKNYLNAQEREEWKKFTDEYNEKNIFIMQVNFIISVATKQ